MRARSSSGRAAWHCWPATSLPTASRWMTAARICARCMCPSSRMPLIPDMHFFAVVFFAVIIVGASNAVNLTDGLDGLATGCSLTTALAYAAFGYVCGNAKYSDYLDVPHHSLASELPDHRDGAGRCVPGLSLVECASGQDVHGRHRQPRSRRLHRHARHRLQAGDRARARRAACSSWRRSA